MRAALLVVAAALAAAPVATAQVPYRTIVVFGDTQTQIEAGERDPLDPLYVGYQAAIDWVVANKHTENIDLVLHTGDAVNNAVQYPLPGTCATTIEKELSECTQADCSPTIPLGCYELGGICRSCHRYRVRADAEWQVFLEPWRQLEPDAGSGWLGVPYAVVRGNHDNVGDTAPDLVETEGYDQYFGNAQQEALELEFVGSDRIFELLETCPATPQGAGEHCPNDPGHAWRMRLGSEDVLVIGPTWNPDDGQVNWVKGVLDRNPTLPAILLHHHFSQGGAQILNDVVTDPAYAEQIFMTVEGHDVGFPNRKRIVDHAGTPTLEVKFNPQAQFLPAARGITLVRFYVDNPYQFDQVETLTLDPVTELFLSGNEVARTPFEIHNDLDEDGTPEGSDNCPGVPNPSQIDMDGDELGDACDNCPDDHNAPEQDDGDKDGLGDACDPDRDNDGIANASDICPDVFDPTQANEDGDDYGDACDFCIEWPNNGQADTGSVAVGFLDGIGDACQCGDADQDGILDADDLTWIGNCIAGTPLPEQEDCSHELMDTDGDGDLDATDEQRLFDALGLVQSPVEFTCQARPTADFDGDGFLDLRFFTLGPLADNCPFHPNPGQEDRNADLVGDACTPFCDANVNGVVDGGDAVLCHDAAATPANASVDRVRRCDVVIQDAGRTNGLVDGGDVVAVERTAAGLTSGVCNPL